MSSQIIVYSLKPNDDSKSICYNKTMEDGTSLNGVKFQQIMEFLTVP